MTIKPLILWHDEPWPGDDINPLVGGKAAGLARLGAFGASVPSWGVLTTGLFGQVCARDEAFSQLLSDQGMSHQARGEAIRSRLAAIPLAHDELELLHDVWERISAGGTIPVAVRSSAVGEDSAALSFAGQMDTYLNVRDENAFLTAVRGCWASLFGERAVAYRLANGIDPWTVRTAVVIQQMIPAEASGVLFTANPLTGNRREMMASSTWGLGEGLVSGTLDADTFILGEGGEVLRQELAEKRERVVPDGHGGIRTEPVPVALQGAPSLTDEQLRELHRIGRTVQEAEGVPMDIEFAVAGGRLYLLQARPVTTLKPATAPAAGPLNVWDNSNIVESYAGVTTPLTFSFIRKAYTAVYIQFWETIGVSRRTIFANRHILENMLGLIEGRVYYNLLNWYRLISLMPGFSWNKGFMEQMIGLQVVGDGATVDAPATPWERYFVHLPRLAWVGARMTAAHLTLERRITAFHEHFARIRAEYGPVEFDRKRPAEIMACYRTLEREVLWQWKAPILNDFEAMIFYGLLKRLTVAWGIDPDGTLQNDLLCGEGNIRSTEVTARLCAIAREIAASPVLKEAFVDCPPREALEQLRTDPAFASPRASFERYLAEFGVRSVEEMKLESVPVRDDPTFCIAMLQNYLRGGLPEPGEQTARERTIRSRAEALLEERLRGKRTSLGIPRLTLFRWILAKARAAIRNRENQRFARAEAYDLVRRMVRAIGRNWEERGLLAHREDIFYLELDEIWSFIGGTSTCTDLRGLVALRRREFEEYRSRTPDDHIETRGEVYVGTPFSTAPAPETGDGTLRGLGCCQGTVEGIVRVVLRPDSGLRLNGEIMVARQTDPGWIVLFPAIGGLIVEKGSMLSHSAIVAREMGIPAVVGVRDATRILCDGDRVRLNGADGTVTILARNGGEGT